MDKNVSDFISSFEQAATMLTTFFVFIVKTFRNFPIKFFDVKNVEHIWKTISFKRTLKVMIYSCRPKEKKAKKADTNQQNQSTLMILHIQKRRRKPTQDIH
jgi:hypothetical protein